MSHQTRDLVLVMRLFRPGGFDGHVLFDGLAQRHVRTGSHFDSEKNFREICKLEFDVDFTMMTCYAWTYDRTRDGRIFSRRISERRRRPFPGEILAVALAETLILMGGLLKRLASPDPITGNGGSKFKLGGESLLTVMFVQTDGLNWPVTTWKAG